MSLLSDVHFCILLYAARVAWKSFACTCIDPVKSIFDTNKDSTIPIFVGLCITYIKHIKSGEIFVSDFVHRTTRDNRLGACFAL